MDLAVILLQKFKWGKKLPNPPAFRQLRGLLQLEVCAAGREGALGKCRQEPQEEEIGSFDMNLVQEFANPNRPLGSTWLPTDE